MNDLEGKVLCKYLVFAGGLRYLAFLLAELCVVLCAALFIGGDSEERGKNL